MAIVKCNTCNKTYDADHGFFAEAPKTYTCQHCGWAAWAVETGYCSQNNGDCETCSLLNYGKDCNNNNITHHLKIN